LVKEVGWSFVGISNGVQNTDRYDLINLFMAKLVTFRLS
jgi:hypothetical protein